MSRSVERADVIVLGAGAAGLMAALTAGQRGKSVVVIDHSEEAGRKILISGGGRCNFTNRDVAPDRFLSANPSFARSALARYRPADFLEMVARHRIAWHEKTLGQLFCDGSAREILEMLFAECAAGRVGMRLGRRVTGVSHGDGYRVETTHGPVEAPALVLATGGLSIPKLGATGLAHDIARQFGLTLTPLYPGLVPLRFAEEWMHGISGVSLPVIARAGKTAFREAMLFTHRGLSGPAVLQISSYWQHDTPLTFNLLPDHDALAFLQAARKGRPKAQGPSILGEHMPQRLAHVLAAQLLPNSLAADWSDRLLRPAATGLNSMVVTPTGTEGYAKAEVTKGGISTKDLSSQTMEARNMPGLYAIGEAVDVTGWLGGYNFHWAWASGRAAGLAIAERA